MTEVVRGPGQVVRDVQSVYFSVVVGVVEDGEQNELDGREGVVIEPEEEGGGRVDHIHLCREEVRHNQVGATT